MSRFAGMQHALKSAVIGLCLSGAAAFAASDRLSLDDVVEFDVLPGWRTESGTHMMALHIQLAPGWKTYWRAPGEASIPPRFDWSGSENLGSVAFHWPTPEVFFQYGLRSIGYSDELVLPIELTPLAEGEGVELHSEIALGVCSDICVPVQTRISAVLSSSGNQDPRIRDALDSQPDTARTAGLRDITCRVEPISDGLRLIADIDMPQVGPSEVAVFELPDHSIWVADARAQRDGNSLRAMTELVPPSGRPFLLDRSTVRITVLGGGRAVDIQGCVG